jgi:hypothetical protein
LIRPFALDSAYFCRDLIEAADTIQKMKTSSGSVIRSLAEMQTSALNLHQKTAGGYIRPFATTTGTETIRITSYSGQLASVVRITNDICRIPDRFFSPDSSRILKK